MASQDHLLWRISWSACYPAYSSHVTANVELVLVQRMLIYLEWSCVCLMQWWAGFRLHVPWCKSTISYTDMCPSLLDLSEFNATTTLPFAIWEAAEAFHVLDPKAVPIMFGLWWILNGAWPSNRAGYMFGVPLLGVKRAYAWAYILVLFIGRISCLSPWTNITERSHVAASFEVK